MLKDEIKGKELITQNNFKTIIIKIMVVKIKI